MTFTSSKLSNGLTILTYNMPGLQSVAINLIIKVGSRYESLTEGGISHFLEHMAFKGTSSRSAKDIAEEFDAIGGDFNAYTGREQTVYYAKVLRENLAGALDILSDIIQNSVFTPQDIEKEYQVIRQEMAQAQDNPDDLAYEHFYKTAYSNQPLGRSILGLEENLAKFNNESFKEFLAKHYNAENMFLSIAGNINHSEAEKYASTLFPSLKNHTNNAFDAANYSGGYHALEKTLEQTTVVLGFQSVPYVNLQKYYHSQILSLILGGGISSRLFQHIRENLSLAYSVGTYNSAYFDSGLFSIYASTSPEKLQLLSTNLVSEIKKIMSHISEDELVRAKAQIKTSIYMAEEKSSYKAEEIGKNFAIFGKYSSADEIMEYIMSTTANDILSIAASIFSSPPTLSIVGTKTLSFDYEDVARNLRK